MEGRFVARLVCDESIEVLRGNLGDDVVLGCGWDILERANDVSQRDIGRWRWQGWVSESGKPDGVESQAIGEGWRCHGD